MEDNGVDGGVLLVHGSPLVKTDFSLGMKHADFTPNSTGYENIRRSFTHIDRRPGECVKVFSVHTQKRNI